MSSSTNPDRPNRLVMGLGIATIVLFSVNLLAMLSQRVWPQLQDLAIFGSQEAIEEVAPNADASVEIFHRPHGKMAYSVITRIQKKKRCYRRHDHNSHVDVQVDVDRSIEMDMERLEREIEHEMQRLNSELSDATSNLEEAISLQLSIDSPNSVFVRSNKIDMSDLEEKMEAVAKKFEVRVQELESSSRTRHLVRVKKEKTN